MAQSIPARHLLLFCLLITLAVLSIVVSLTLRLIKRLVRGSIFPSARSVHLLFQERWTSGRSLRSFHTRWGGAKSCLWVTVTEDELWLRPHLPFTLIGDYCDLVHRIAKRQITAIERNARHISISFTTDLGDRQIELYLRQPDLFMTAMAE